MTAVWAGCGLGSSSKPVGVHEDHCEVTAARMRVDFCVLIVTLNSDLSVCMHFPISIFVSPCWQHIIIVLLVVSLCVDTAHLHSF